MKAQPERQHTEPVIPAGWQSYRKPILVALCALGIAVIMAVMFYVVEPGNFFTYSPWHHDDYRELFKNFDYAIDFNLARPVTEFVYRWLANAGPLTFYLALHALLAVDLALFFFLALDILGCERLSWQASVSALLFGTIVCCSSPNLSAIVKYTGNIDHLTSLFFGILSILFLSRSLKQDSVFLIAVSVLLFALSILAKEDTVPFLGVAALLKGVPALRSQRSLFYKASLVGAGLVSLGIIGFLLSPTSGNSWYMLRMALNGENRAYGIHTSFDELVAVIRYLAWPSAYYQRVHVAFLVVAVAHVAATRRLTALGATALFAALLAPYSVLGVAHVFGYYRFNFSPFAVYCAFIMAAQLVQLAQESGWIPQVWRQSARVLWALVCVGAVAILFRAARPERQDILAWHNNLQAISRNILDRVTELKPALKERAEIHVVGADRAINPFFWQEGVMYINREILGASVKWIVHYKPDSELAKTLETYNWTRADTTITYAPDGGEPEQGQPRIEVDASYHATFIDRPQ